MSLLYLTIGTLVSLWFLVIGLWAYALVRAGR